jgi:uncharacterized DUF497 family protein
MKFAWDEQKAHTNFRKHKVSFDEAVTVFDDPLFLVFADAEHSVEEPRFIAMGESTVGKLLIVAFTQSELVMRIVSARTATRSERKFYEEEG